MMVRLVGQPVPRLATVDEGVHHAVLGERVQPPSGRGPS